MASSKSKKQHPTSRNPPPYSGMSTKTKFFIQKICYKKTASIDMTKNGFVKYATMMHPVNLLLKPLREQLNKILGKRKDPAKNPKNKRKPTPLRKKIRDDRSVAGSTSTKRRLAKKKKAKDMFKAKKKLQRKKRKNTS